MPKYLARNFFVHLLIIGCRVIDYFYYFFVKFYTTLVLIKVLNITNLLIKRKKTFLSTDCIQLVSDDSTFTSITDRSNGRCR